VIKALLKYIEVARINVRSSFAYLGEQLLAGIHLVIIIFVFVQLWKVTYGAAGGGPNNGYSLSEMVWYLVGTEAIVMSLPRIHATLQDEVKGGDLAIRLNKPYNYLLFHYSSTLGEGLVRLLRSILLGGLTAYLCLGGFAFAWRAIPLLLVIFLVTQAVNFCYNASIGLLSFWVEDVSGFFLIFDKAKWLLGGLLLPIEVYPPAARKVAEALPFRYMISGPARLFVKFNLAEAGALLGQQLIWLVLFGAVCAGLYRLGVRRVDVNGG